MHTEDDLLPISALQHLLFCERQTALIHIERLWVENRFTAEGRVLHRNADAARSETRDGIRITRGLPVHSFQLGLFGVCDVVNFKPPEFEPPGRRSLAKRIEEQLRSTRGHISGPPSDQEGNTDTIEHAQPGLRPRVKQEEQTVQSDSAAFAHWSITPVEYKRGKPKANDCDRVQLCAQAMCLEEMLGVTIPSGDLFYGKRQRRTEVTFDETLRQLTTSAAERFHKLIASGQTPTAQYEKKCDTCSLLPVCLPNRPGQKSATDYLNTMINESA